MKQIKQLVGMMREELHDAQKYARCAMAHKETDKHLADMYAELARQELDHAGMEHEQAVRLIKEYGKEPPAAMQAIWDWEHEQMIEEESEIRVMLEMYHK